MDKRHFGSTLDSLFEELGELDQMNERLAKRSYADRLMEVMRRRKISLSEFARTMRTSRTSAKRLLDHTVPGVTLDSLGRAARAVGMAFDPGLIEVSKQATYPQEVRPEAAPARGGEGRALRAKEPALLRGRPRTISAVHAEPTVTSQP